MSDRMSISSATTTVTSHPGGTHPNPQPQHQQSYNHSPNPNSYASPTTYFYPSSHIHNAPAQLPQQPYPHAVNPYASAPEVSSHQLPPSLTQILLNSSPHQFALATRHPFLRLAGQGHLPKQTLSRWLSQDRLYAQSYIGFIGSLIARVDLPYVAVADKSTSLRWRLVHTLTSALDNIHTELKFFHDTADKYGLDLETASRPDAPFTAEPATKQYIDLFRAFWTDPSMSLLEGMVVLWATETVYLRAWRYAASFMAEEKKQAAEEGKDRKSKGLSSDGIMSELEGSEVSAGINTNTNKPANSDTHADTDTPAQSQPNHSADLDTGALRDAFIPNWTSRPFENFVAEIAELTDLLAEREDAVARRLEVYQAVWAHILDVERRFWPDVGVSD
jgi:thiaminase